jgi:riboflavin kinase / FMN adenylyltransferase
MLSVLMATSNELIKTPTAIALGNFDGIHRGHQVVLQKILGYSKPHLYSSVVSFIPHPREFFTGRKQLLLTPVAEKEAISAKLGIEQLILLPFDRVLAALSPQEFVEKIIVKQLQAQKISVGADFHFGYQRKGKAQDLQAIAAKFGIEVHLNTLHQCRHQEREVRISSSLIRQALLTGDIKEANFMLGRSYTLMGEVVKGQQLGRTIGFPTANIQVPDNKFLPRFGVYAVTANIDLNLVKGVMNIGCRPTVLGESPTIEVHLLNWSKDLYGKTIIVELNKFLRPEQKFPSLDALKQQIAADCQAALSGSNE